MNIFPLGICWHPIGMYCDDCRPIIPVPTWFPLQPSMIERFTPILVGENPKKLKRGQIFEDESGKLHIFDGNKWITIEEEKSSELKPKSEAVSSV